MLGTHKYYNYNKMIKQLIQFNMRRANTLALIRPQIFYFSKVANSTEDFDFNKQILEATLDDVKKESGLIVNRFMHLNTYYQVNQSYQKFLKTKDHKPALLLNDLIEQFCNMSKQSLQPSESGVKKPEPKDIDSFFRSLEESEIPLKRAQFSQLFQLFSKMPNKQVKAASIYIESNAKVLINQKNDLYFLEFLQAMRSQLPLFSEDFKLFLFDTISKRIQLLHRNLSGIITIAESLLQLGDVPQPFWESLQTFICGQLHTLAVNQNNSDQILQLTEVFTEELGMLNENYAESLSFYLTQSLSVEGNEGQTYKYYEKIAQLIPYLGTSKKAKKLQEVYMNTIVQKIDKHSFTALVKNVSSCNVRLNEELRGKIIERFNKKGNLSGLSADIQLLKNHIIPLYRQIKDDVDANMFKEFISSQIAKLIKGLNKSDFRLVYQTLIELNEMQKELSDIMPEKIDLIEEKILAEMIQSKEIFSMSEQLKLFTLAGGIEEVASLMEFRIKRHFVDEPQIDKMTIEEALWQS
ncbi:hypothetical protein FGO68_gene3251 [Halteria grandinella]|uniref:Uncharacterized protein n=1 Tax=Halteria grandinella TaxID=5974 RepID=A0A8J8NH53_HALGN|nr:hypothetical protein FGO68_gene3251 [Halteria grandinella]